MSWSAYAATMTPSDYYTLLERHRLLPSSDSMIPHIIAVSERGRFVKLMNGEDEVATVLFSNIVNDESFEMDMIINPAYFIEGQYEQDLRGCLGPVINDMFLATGARRVYSAVPKTYARTKYAMMAMGFKKEGQLREAAHFLGREPEDIIALALLRREWFGGA